MTTITYKAYVRSATKRNIINMETKICSACKEKKTINSFGNNKNTISGKSYYCKLCESKMQRERYRGTYVSRLQERELRLENALFSIKITKTDKWIPVCENLPDTHIVVNVRLEDGRYTNSFLLSDKTWAYNITPTHWCYVQE